MNKRGFTLVELSSQEFSPLRGELEGGSAQANKPSPNPSLREGSLRGGFTLVELSIVLVIIGLIVTGLIVSQSIMQIAKMQVFIKKIQEYDTAVGGFQEIHKGIPGDSSLFSTNGNDDGLIGEGTTNTNDWTTGVWTGEVTYFWQNLTLVGLDGGYTAGAGPTVTGEDYPANSYGVDTGGLVAFGMSSTGKNYYQPGISANGSNTISSSITLTARQAGDLDAKMDDGIANAGIVRATGGTAGPGQAPSNAGPGAAGCVLTAEPAVYNVTYSAFDACQVMIEINSRAK